MFSFLTREVKLSVVSYLTNSIVDQILQELYATHKTLVRREQRSAEGGAEPARGAETEERGVFRRSRCPG